MATADTPSAIPTSLTGRHALVCGASAGIGRATALALAAAGAEVTVLARRQAVLESLLPELESAGAPAAHALVADHDDRPGLARAVDAHLAAHGPLEILVNNSGGPPPGRLLDAGEDALRLGFDRHVLASQLLVQKLLPGMRTAGFGRIVNVVSTSVYEPIPGLGASNVARAAIAAWAKTLSRELPPGVTINNVLPGYVDTGRLAALAEGLAGDGGPEAVRARWLAEVPEGRLGTPAEVGAVIAFLVSPAASYVRGQSLAVDGGRMRST